MLACTHFPLLAEELAAALPGVAFVDGGPGIARRVAHLTQGQDWPEAPPAGAAVFTALGPAERALTPALAAHGLARMEQL